MADELLSLALDLDGQLVVDFEALKQHWLQALREKCHCEFKIGRQCFFDVQISSLRQIPMEHKVEVVGVDRHLVSDLVLLVVQEVFEELLFL